MNASLPPPLNESSGIAELLVPFPDPAHRPVRGARQMTLSCRYPDQLAGCGGDHRSPRSHDAADAGKLSAVWLNRTDGPAKRKVELALGADGNGGGSSAALSEVYFDLNIRHFHEKLRHEHQIGLSYTWVQLALQGAGLVAKRRKRGAAPAEASCDDHCRACCCTSTAANIGG